VLDLWRRRNHQDALVCELVEALLLEHRITYSRDFAQDEDIGVSKISDRKPKAHVHPGVLGLDRLVDRRLKLREADDRIELLPHLSLGQPSGNAADENVLASTEREVKTDPQFQQCPDSTIDGDLAIIWL
jgi:hypothetical protein